MSTPPVENLTTEKIPIFIMGKQYMVPDSLTIMKAMEYAGFKFVRGAGCRGGICGACGTVCGNGEACVGGACVCSRGLSACGGGCGAGGCRS